MGQRVGPAQKRGIPPRPQMERTGVSLLFNKNVLVRLSCNVKTYRNVTLILDAGGPVNSKTFLRTAQVS